MLHHQGEALVLDRKLDLSRRDGEGVAGDGPGVRRQFQQLAGQLPAIGVGGFVSFLTALRLHPTTSSEEEESRPPELPVQDPTGLAGVIP